MDDDELLIQVGNQMLAALGYRAESSSDRVAALALVRADPARFSLVAACNLCPCGYRGHPVRSCACTPPALTTCRMRRR